MDIIQGKRWNDIYWVVCLCVALLCGDLLFAEISRPGIDQTELGTVEREYPVWHLEGYLAALQDPSPDVFRQAILRPEAAELIRRLKDRVVKIAPRLIELLKDPEDQVREAAAFALGALEDGARQQLKTLLELLQTDDKQTREAVVQTLILLGSTTSAQAGELVTLLHGPEKTRQAAVDVLVGLGEQAEAQIPMIAGKLTDPEPQVRAAAAEVLGGLGPNARIHVHKLVALLLDQHPTVRSAAMESLMFLGVPRDEDREKLTLLLNHKDAEVRVMVLKALGPLPDPKAAETAHMLGMLRDPEPNIRAQVLKQFGGVDDEGHISQLFNLMRGHHPDVRAQVLKPYGVVITEDADEYTRNWEMVPDVVEKRNDRKEALAALIPETLLAQILDDSEDRVRYAAVRLVRGEVARSHASRLLELLGDRHEKVRSAAVDTLGSLQDAGGQLMQLGRLLEHPNRLSRQSAIQVMKKIGEPASEFAPRIMNFIEAGSLDAYEVGEALLAMGQVAIRQQVPRLLRMLENPDQRVAYAAATVLQQIGSGRKEFAGQLLDLLNHPNQSVQFAAASACSGLVADAPDQLTKVVGLLRDHPDKNVRNSVVSAFSPREGTNTQWVEEAAWLVSELFTVPDPGVRYSAIIAFYSLVEPLGEGAKAYIPQLIALLRDIDPDIRQMSLVVLVTIARDIGGLNQIKDTLAISLSKIRQPDLVLSPNGLSTGKNHRKIKD